MESKAQQIVENISKGNGKQEEEHPMYEKVFRKIELSAFQNYDEVKNAADEEMDEEKRAENVEMTEQEIEALQQILNEEECQVLKVGEHSQEELAASQFCGIIKEELDQIGVKFLITLSIVPKFPQDQAKFQIVDKVMNNKINVAALPVIEMVIALPSSYPSNQKPMFLQRTKFYGEFGKYDEFLIEQVNEKWSEDMPVLYDIAIFLQDEFMEQFLEQMGPETADQEDSSLISLNFKESPLAQYYTTLCQQAYRRQFDEEQHRCDICTEDLLGSKFFFMSGCEHFFCEECILSMVKSKIVEGQIAHLKCANQACGKAFSDNDIKNLSLDEEEKKKYEKLSLDNAIANMDDLGWCPVPGCGQLANIEKQENYGKCSFCDFRFCLDCKERHHPSKRCPINRVDLMSGLMDKEDIKFVLKQNQRAEEILNKLYIKHCTKSCPNPKCGVPIAKIESGCTQVQCPKCYQYMCWACGSQAKGQKHYKEKPGHYDDAGTLLPLNVTKEIIQKFANENLEWVNLKLCAFCPDSNCKQINQKEGDANLITCKSCQKPFCYICNKSIQDESHYKGNANCKEFSDPFTDF